MSEKPSNLSAFIAENFGANATYVEGLLARYQADPNSVDESWQTYFSELLGGANGAPAAASKPEAAPSKPEPTQAAPIKESTQAAATSAATVPADASAKPLTGASKKIVENMELSLTVPTATSFRNIPVKLLEENRRLINESLQESGRGKVSFTHLIGWAIVQAAKTYPAMNNGFGVVNGKPENIPVDDSHPLDSPVLGASSDPVIYRFVVFEGAFDEIICEGSCFIVELGIP